MKRVKITGVSKVTKQKGTDAEKSRTVGQGGGGKSQGLPEKPEETSGEGQGEGKPSSKPSQLPGAKKPEKKGPGQITLGPEEKMDENFIKKIREAVENPEDWDIGKVGRGGKPGEIGKIVDGVPVESDEDEPEDRSWGENAEQKIDQAIKEAIRREAEEREKKKNTEKTKGGSGVGGFRDRIRIQDVAKTDWAKIFESRLTEYSRERAKHLPYDRRLSGGPLGRTLPSSTETKDVLPETNIVIDTSSSLSYVEMEVILTELKFAISAAKITKVNVILWTGEPYWYKQYNDVNGSNFDKIINDIQENWKGGGNDIDKVYELMIKKGWTKKFTIHLTDGWIQDHRENPTRQLSAIVHDPSNTIFGIIYPSQRITWDQFMRTANMFPGEKVPIFLDTKKFGV